MLPAGTVLAPGRVTVRESGRLLLGGTPRRLLRLSDRGAGVARRLLAGEPARTDLERTLGRRLAATGLARSYPPAGERPTVTVLVPVRDRAAALGRCLDALGGADPVVVVDDGSTDPAAVASVCARPHVTLLRRPAAGGPAAARTTGLAVIDTEVVVCVDSDVEVTAGWLEPLLAHLADPLVAAVAPRVRPGPAAGLLGRYLAVASPLDLGPDDLPVRPGSPLAYVPSAALVLRRPLAVFDPALRYGEDVDLVWRIIAAGHQVRYEPRVTVTHTEPATWRAALARRHRYGTSAGALARRHPGLTAHLLAGPLPMAGAAAAVLPTPLAVAVAAATTATAAVRMRGAGLPGRDAAALAAGATGHAAVGLGRYLGQLTPALLVATRRPRLAALLATPALVTWVRRRPALDPVTFALLSQLDGAAYGSGVWRGALAARTAEPLLPSIRRHPTDTPRRRVPQRYLG